MCTMMEALPATRTGLDLPQVGLFWELPLKVKSLPISVSVTTSQANIIAVQEFQCLK